MVVDTFFFFLRNGPQLRNGFGVGTRGDGWGMFGQRSFHADLQLGSSLTAEGMNDPTGSIAFIAFMTFMTLITFITFIKSALRGSG